MARGRRDVDHAILMALACGATVEAAARTAGVGQATIYRRLKEPAFRRRLQEMRSDMVQRTAGMLTASAGEGVKTLVALLKDASPPAVRLGAARAVIELGLKVREQGELEDRITELESRLEDITQS